MNILVTAAGSAIGQGIIKSIRASKIDCKIIATDADSQALGLYRADAGYLVPLAKDPGFIDKIIEICRKENVNLICIGTDYELLAFAENKENIEKETDAMVVVSPPNTIKIADDKWLTHEFLKENNFPTIPSALPEDSEELIKNEGFPLILKPRVGDSSKKTFIINSKKELHEKLAELMNEENQNKYLKIKSGFIVQKFIEGDEYTTTTLKIGKVLGTISMKREMRYGGHTTKAIIEDYPEINSEIKKVADKLTIFGPCNFQSRIYKSKPHIFEINCRFSGTTATCSLAGFNIVEALIKNILLKQKPGQLKHENGTMIRYFNEVFIPAEEIAKMQKKGNVKRPKSKFSVI